MTRDEICMTNESAISSARIAEYRRPRRRSYAQRMAIQRCTLESHDSRPGGIDWSQSAILGHRTAAARDFADLVSTRLINGTLPWTQRQSLLRQAAHRGISRFEANLIIAAVANYFRPLDVAPAPAEIGESRRTRNFFVLRGLAALLAIEIVVLAGVWHFLF
jgi:hypothetical protein